MKQIIRRNYFMYFCEVVLFVCKSFINKIKDIIVLHSGRTDYRGGHNDYLGISGLGNYHFHNGGSPYMEGIIV